MLRSGVELQAAASGSYTQTMAWGFTLHSLLRSALVHKYGDVFSWRTEYRSPSFNPSTLLRTGFDPSRRRDNTAPHQEALQASKGERDLARGASSGRTDS